jgi:hypothetical protein
LFSVRVFNLALGKSEVNQGGKLHELHSHFSKTPVGNSRDDKNNPREALLLRRKELLLERIYLPTPFDLNRFSRYSAVFLQYLAQLT